MKLRQGPGPVGALRRLAPWLVAGALAAWALSGCGGQTPALVIDAPAAQASAPAPPVTQLAGLYTGTLNGNVNHEFLTLVVPQSDKRVHVYGWYYNADDPHLAHLYEGLLELGIEGRATNVAQSWRVIEGVSSYAASADVSGASLSQLTAAIAVSRSSVTNYTLAARALPATDYAFSSAAPDMSSSRWNGYWSSRTDTFIGSLQFDSQGAPNASGTYWPCLTTGAPLRWTWTAQTHNTFKVELALGPNTYCTQWQNRQLSGVATVSSPNGQPQLDMMLLDGAGAGMSYRGTR